MSTISLSEFNTTTKDDWFKQANKDLKGKDFDETLVWKLQEGFKIEPYFSVEDLDPIKNIQIQEAQQSKIGLGWQNRCKIKFINEKDTNSLIIKALQVGADAVEIDFELNNLEEINFMKLLQNIKFSDSPVFFKSKNSEKIFNELSKFVNYHPKGGFNYDFVSAYFNDTDTSITDSTWESTKALIEKTTEFQNFTTLSVSSHAFHESGANIAQELGFTLNLGVLYLDKLTDLGLKIESILPKLEFSISVGTNYFFEIAKIRALRFLWNRILENYGFEKNQFPTRIHCQTSYFYDSAATPNTNMLRATTEGMSAVVGGCDSLTIHPYNEVFEASNELSERISRNISLLLKEESYLDKTHDASAGSYYIEKLSIDLAESAWEIFLEVEKQNGILAAFESGFLRSEIDKSFESKVEDLKNGKIMVGVNKFRFDEKEFQKQNVTENTDSRILPKRRLATIFE